MEETDIISRLVGDMNSDMQRIMFKNIECFLTPSLSIFVPTSGQCPYAVSPDHKHPVYSFIYCIQPFLDIIVEGKDVNLSVVGNNCLSVMSPNILHQEKRAEFFQSYIAILVEKNYFEKILLEYCDTVPILKGELFTASTELLGLLKCFMLEKRQYENHELLTPLSEIITHSLARSVANCSNSDIPVYDKLEVDRAIAYMRGHLSENISLKSIAAHVNISEGYFSRTFKKYTGDSPMDYLNSMRLNKARNMITDGYNNITDIALECGFRSPSYFSTRFLEKYNVSPSSYMKGIK